MWLMQRKNTKILICTFQNISLFHHIAKGHLKSSMVSVYIDSNLWCFLSI